MMTRSSSFFPFLALRFYQSPPAVARASISRPRLPVTPVVTRRLILGGHQILD
jgi:hypothetical protein